MLVGYLDIRALSHQGLNVFDFAVGSLYQWCSVA